MERVKKHLSGEKGNIYRQKKPFPFLIYHCGEPHGKAEYLVFT